MRLSDVTLGDTGRDTFPNEKRKTPRKTERRYPARLVNERKS
jgi:hypothetical protein